MDVWLLGYSSKSRYNPIEEQYLCCRGAWTIVSYQLSSTMDYRVPYFQTMRVATHTLVRHGSAPLPDNNCQPFSYPCVWHRMPLSDNMMWQTVNWTLRRQHSWCWISTEICSHFQLPSNSPPHLKPSLSSTTSGVKEEVFQLLPDNFGLELSEYQAWGGKCCKQEEW